MKTNFYSRVFLASLALFFALTFRARSQTVDIPDPALQAAIRNALNKPTSDITVQDMESLHKLDASIWARFGGNTDAIQSLKGLETAKNLESLDLGGFTRDQEYGVITINIAFSDFGPLAGLTHLTTLSLRANALTNLALPSGLDNLKELDLGVNRLADFSFLERLDSLKRLDLGFNHLTNFVLPARQHGLESLTLGYNQLTSLTLPKGMTNLTD